MLPNGGKSITLKFWTLEDFRGVPVSFFHKDQESYILVHDDDFFIVGDRRGEGMH